MQNPQDKSTSRISCKRLETKSTSRTSCKAPETNHHQGTRWKALRISCKALQTNPHLRTSYLRLSYLFCSCSAMLAHFKCLYTHMNWIQCNITIVCSFALTQVYYLSIFVCFYLHFDFNCPIKCTCFKL